MASHFAASTCRLDGDAFVSHLNWSKMDSIAAMAVSTVDQNDRETHAVLFVNNAGTYTHATHADADASCICCIPRAVQGMACHMRTC